MGVPWPNTETGEFQVPVLIDSYDSDGQDKVVHMQCQPHILGFFPIGSTPSMHMKFRINNQISTFTDYVCSVYDRCFLQKKSPRLSPPVGLVWMKGGKRKDGQSAGQTFLKSLKIQCFWHMLPCGHTIASIRLPLRSPRCMAGLANLQNTSNPLKTCVIGIFYP